MTLYSDLIFPYDYLILIISLILIFFSFWKGFINSLLGLLTWIGSFIITIYSYNSLSEFISNQLLKIEFLNSYESITSILSIIISIPLIFLLSLFILRKIRKFLSSDLDKQILGLLIDKFFGLIYGILFSYIIFATLLYGLDQFEFFSNLKSWLINNSEILNTINQNNLMIYEYANPNEI